MTVTWMFVLTWAALLGTLLLVLRLVRRLRFVLDPFRNPPPMPSLAAGQPAPPFEAAAFDGGTVRSADFADRTLTIVYLSHQCATCRSHMPGLTRAYAMARGGGSELLVVVLDEDSTSHTATQRMIEKHAVRATVVLAEAGHPLRRHYNPGAMTPYFCHVERGVVRATGGYGADAWVDLVDTWRRAVRPAATGAS